MLCVYAPFLKTFCHLLKCNISFWLNFYSEAADGKVRHSRAFELRNFQKIVSQSSKLFRNLRFQWSANSDLASFKKLSISAAGFPQNVDQVTVLYPRPKMAADFKRKIHYPRTFSVYRRPCPRWPLTKFYPWVLNTCITTIEKNYMQF